MKPPVRREAADDPMSHPLFADIAKADLPARLGTRSFRAGKLIFDRGEETRDVYLIHSGWVLAVYLSEDGRELIYGRIGAGAYLGEIAAIDGGPRSLSAYARTNAVVSILPQADFLEMFETSSAFRMNVVRKLTTFVRAMNERNVAMTVMKVESRVRAHIARLALEADQFRPGGCILDAPTHAEIAGSVDANREAVSRTLSQLNRSGIINSSRRRLILLSPEDLLADAVL